MLPNTSSDFRRPPVSAPAITTGSSSDDSATVQVVAAPHVDFR